MDPFPHGEHSTTPLLPVWVEVLLSAVPLAYATCLCVVFLAARLLSRKTWIGQFIHEPVEQDADPKLQKQWPQATIFLGVLSTIGFATQLATVLLYLGIIPVITWALAGLILVLAAPRTAPMSLLGLHVLLLASRVVSLLSSHTTYSPQIILDAISVAVSLMAIVIILNMPLRDPAYSRAEISQPFTAPTAQLRSPEDHLTPWQWMTVSWMASLIAVGSKRQLQDDDVWSLGYEFQHTHLHNAFRKLKGTVVRRLLRANGIDLLLLAMLAIVELVANYSAPLILQQLLQAMDQVRLSARPAMTFALLTLIVRLVAAQSAVFSLWYGRRCYERSRGEMITMLYEKTLNRKIVSSVRNEDDEKPTTSAEEELLDDEGEQINDHGLANGHAKATTESTAYSARVWNRVRTGLAKVFRKKERMEEKKAPTSMGKLLNLMRADVYEVAQRFWEFQTLVNKPLGLILSLVLLWRLIGWPCLVGVAVVVVAQALNAVLARQLMSWEQKRRKATDGRLQQTSQYIEAIRHLRWYGWHPTWLRKIMDARQKELNLKIVTYIWRMLVTFVNTLASGSLPLAAFYAYTTLAGQRLRVDIAFPAWQLFGMLQNDLREIPDLIIVLLNASVAVGRIEDFMSEPDRALATAEEEPDSTADHLELIDASFAWPGFSSSVLHNLTLTFPHGLTVVYGEVAAGKTALLQALLGEMDLRDGQFITSGEPVGYCAQTPWLQSMSIRDNILFSSPYEDARYKHTLDACALTADLANFKHGDLSNIGENGIGLSGGQKARVALARAVYSRSSLLFLDDPLSALDQQTAESIVAKCLGGELMKDRTIVLVTHRVDLCKGLAQQWIELLNGSARVHQGEDLVSPSTIAAKKDNSSGDGAAKDQESAAVPDKFIEEEHRAHGGVKLAVYWAYVKAGRYRWWFALTATATTFRLLMILQSWFLKSWTEAYGEPQERLLTLQYESLDASNPLSRQFDRLPDPGVNVQPWLIGFLIIVVSQSFMILISQSFMLVVTYTAGKRMFKDIMDKVSNATFRFYDVTPIGRLMNRLTSDIGTIDGAIAGQLHNFMWQSVSWVSSVVVIAAVTPSFLVFSTLLTITFVVIFLRFLPTSQSLRRLEMVSLSPLMSNFGALVEGLTTVRAFCVQSRFQDRVIAVTDTFQKMDHFYWSLQAWLMYRFDTLSACSTFILTLLAIYTGVSPGLTAFVLIAAGKLVQATHSLCKQYGQLQMDFVSVERVVELLGIEQESVGTIEPPAWWPSYASDIVFEKVTIRYAPNLDPALSQVSFTLKGGSNTAVIGRTGSGKSTLALALLGTITPESGRILINGIDIAKVDKQALRTRVSFLAQDPVLFPGSMRQNLDPTEEHTDTECEAVLARVCGRFGWTLDTQIDTGGKNLSQGQRQLVGLSRAILRRSAIVIMDEATASIDKESAWEIQRVLREEMKYSTVITIAHRPSAVRGAEYCIQLGNGKVIEQGKPGDMAISREGKNTGAIEDEDTI